LGTSRRPQHATGSEPGVGDGCATSSSMPLGYGFSVDTGPESDRRGSVERQPRSRIDEQAHGQYGLPSAIRVDQASPVPVGWERFKRWRLEPSCHTPSAVRDRRGRHGVGKVGFTESSLTRKTGAACGALRERCERRPDAAALLCGVAAVARFGRSNIRRLPAPFRHHQCASLTPAVVTADGPAHKVGMCANKAPPRAPSVTRRKPARA
jgi:hypothetical protein